MQRGTLKGRLLVATPMLGDPNFDRTVVLILEHGAEGAVGVVLNRPSDTHVATALPSWGPLAAEPATVYVGGPVGRTVLVGLGEQRGGAAYVSDPDPARQHWTPLLGAIGTVDLGRGPDGLDPPLQRVRIFAGYAGWNEGQLEGEIEANAWFVVDAEPGDALSPAPDDLWSAVLRRQPDERRLLANYPRDPATN